VNRIIWTIIIKQVKK